jgi:hypothetical protein
VRDISGHMRMRARAGYCKWHACACRACGCIFEVVLTAYLRAHARSLLHVAVHEGYVDDMKALACMPVGIYPFMYQRAQTYELIVGAEQ